MQFFRDLFSRGPGLRIGQWICIQDKNKQIYMHISNSEDLMKARGLAEGVTVICASKCVKCGRRARLEGICFSCLK